MPRTNFEKLTRFDADFYKSLSDEDCIVCLTEKQIYVLGQTLEQIGWARTRWIGDTSGLDFDAISSDIQYALREKMTCETLELVLERIIRLEEQIQLIYNETQENEGVDIFAPDTTVIDDVNTTQELTDFGVSAATCDSAGKDAIYSACNTLVRYIVQNNVDFLERFSQSLSASESAERLISAIPAVGLLPIDEIIGYAAFISEELLEEYNATVDETLIQSVVCDLFCIAVANNCTLDFNDVFGYFADKVAPTLNNFATTYLELVVFATTGTFATDDYFYYMCYFQLVTVGMGQFFLSLNSVESYALKARDGLSSPDDGWTIYCTSCPTFTHWEYNWDFAWGLGEFVIVEGTLAGNYIESVDVGTTKSVVVRLNFTADMDIENIASTAIANGHIGNGSHDFHRQSVYTLIDNGGTETVLYNANFLTVNDIDVDFCADSDIAANVTRSIRIWGATDEAGGAVWVRLKRVRIVGFDNGNGKPVLARWRTAEPLCSEY